MTFVLTFERERGVEVRGSKWNSYCEMVIVVWSWNSSERNTGLECWVNFWIKFLFRHIDLCAEIRLDSNYGFDD